MTLKAVVPALALACGLLAGCASQPGVDQELRTPTPTTGEETQDQVRARIHTELAAGYYSVAGSDPGRLAIALEEVTIALKIDPNYGPAHNVAGLVYGALKQDGQAEASFQRALSINPYDSRANNNYGLFLCDRKREKESFRYFMAAVKNPLYRTPEGAYTNAGVCAQRIGDAQAAEGYFREALRLRPNDPQARLNLAELAYQRKDYLAAKRELDILMRVIKPNAQALWLGVKIERGVGDAASAASYAQQLRKNFPDSKEAQALSAGRLE